MPGIQHTTSAILPSLRGSEPSRLSKNNVALQTRRNSKKTLKSLSLNKKYITYFVNCYRGLSFTQLPSKQLFTSHSQPYFLLLSPSEWSDWLRQYYNFALVWALVGWLFLVLRVSMRSGTEGRLFGSTHCLVSRMMGGSIVARGSLPSTSKDNTLFSPITASMSLEAKRKCD